MKTVRLFISYTFLILTFATYIVVLSYSYDRDITKARLEQQIEDLKENNDDLMLEINMKNSRDSVARDYPNLKFNNNINQLEAESEE